MLKLFWCCVLLVAMSLAACGTVATASKDSPDSSVADQQFADAMKLVADKNWPQAVIALQIIIEDKSFGGLSGDFQYKVLATASRLAIYHGPPKQGYEYLRRVIAMPQAGYGDWLERLREASTLGNEADEVSTLTVLMRRWPDQARELDADYIQNTANLARRLPHAAALPLLQALYDAHWKLKWDVEPSELWRDLALLLLEKNRLTEANEAAGRVTDVYVLVAMRADRRFDAVVAANSAQFDIGAAAEREFHALQTESEKAPQSLEAKSRVINSLLHQQHYEAALAAADSTLLDIRSTNYPDKLFVDYEEELSSFLDLRSTALQRVGRWDEALAQLTAASALLEKYSGNVDQLINLGVLYCELGRPHDALSAIGRLVAGVSPFGAMQLEEVRLDATYQLGDSKQVDRSLQFLRLHRRDAPSSYVDALITVNQLDRAAHELIAEMRDTGERQEALLSTQAFAPTPGTPRDVDLEARRRAVIARPDVQAAIRKVGRVESVPLEGG